MILSEAEPGELISTSSGRHFVVVAINQVKTWDGEIVKLAPNTPCMSHGQAADWLKQQVGL